MGLYLTIFSATVVLELPVYLAGLARRLGAARALAWIVALNVITHPVVYFVFPLLIARYWPMVIAAECFAITVEGAIVFLVVRRAPRPLTLPGAYGLAFAANAFSTVIGLSAYRALWGPLPDW